MLGSKFVSVGVLSDDFAAVDFREELCYHSRPKEAKFKRNTEREKSKEESRARRKKREPVRSGSAGAAPRRRAFGLIFRAVSFDGRRDKHTPESHSPPPRGLGAGGTRGRSPNDSEAADLFKTSTRQNPTPQTFPQLYPNFIYNKKGRALRGEKGRNYDTERTA